jgi:hypothetical protein
LDDIAGLAERCPDLQVYSPPAKQRDTITPAAERNRRSQLKHEPQAVKDWRGRMASEEGKATYRRRKLTEHAHAKMKNRGFDRMPVHGIAKVRSVCLLHAIAHEAVIQSPPPAFLFHTAVCGFPCGHFSDSLRQTRRGIRDEPGHSPAAAKPYAVALGHDQFG